MLRGPDAYFVLLCIDKLKSKRCKNTPVAKLARLEGVFQVCSKFLEAVPQRELHHSRARKRLRVLAESAAYIDFRQYAERIEPH
jgi:hypothetical protein